MLDWFLALPTVSQIAAVYLFVALIAVIWLLCLVDSAPERNDWP